MLAIKVKAENYNDDTNGRVGVQPPMIIYLHDSMQFTYVHTDVASVNR